MMILLWLLPRLYVDPSYRKLIGRKQQIILIAIVNTECCGHLGQQHKAQIHQGGNLLLNQCLK